MEPYKRMMLFGLSALAVTPLAAQQEVKPRPEPLARLPAPGKLSATQQPDGSIRVVWSAVDGAARYSLTRSVPPEASRNVSLPNPADTQYIDTDVRPGSTYYYLVGAINEAGIVGLKAGTSPVKAEDVARVPGAPADVRAALSGNSVDLSWRSSGSDVSYRIEQGTSTQRGPEGFVVVGESRVCCQFRAQLLNAAPGAKLVYRIFATNTRGVRSPPGMSNELSVPGDTSDTTEQVASSDSTSGGAAADSSGAGSSSAKVRPAVVAPTARLKVGGTLKLASNTAFTDLHLRQVHWVSLNESRATVDSRGQVRGIAPGVSHVVALGLTPDGAVASVVQRIEVTRR